MFTGKTILASILIVSGLFLGLRTNAGPRRQRKIRIEDGKDEKYRFRIQSIAEAANDEIAFCFGGATPKMMAIFSPDKKGPATISRGAVYVPLGERPASPRLEVTITSALLLRYAQEVEWQAGRQPGDVPKWIVAAIVYRTWQKMASAPPAAWYPAARQWALAKETPDLVSLTRSPISPELPLLFRLYADICACAFRCVYNDRHSPLTSLLTTADKNSLKPVAKVLKLPPSSVQPWFDKAFPALALGNPVPATLARLKEQLAEALDSGKTDADGNSLGVDEAMQRVPGFKLPAVERKTIHIKLLQLRIKTPPLFIPAIDEFVEACHLLVKGSDWRSRRRFRSARASFDKAWKRAKAIEDFLISHERGRYSTARKIDRMLQRNPVKSVKETEFEKQLRAYFDSYEKKLEDAFIHAK